MEKHYEKLRAYYVYKRKSSFAKLGHNYDILRNHSVFSEVHINSQK